MQRAVPPRPLVIGSLAAVTALIAHGGPSALRQPLWLALALLGGLPTAAGLAVAARRLARLRALAAEPCPAPLGPAPAGTPFASLLGMLLAAQAAAHLALVAAGVSAALPGAGAPCLHAALALLAATLVWTLERLLARAFAAASAALAQLLERLLAAASLSGPGAGRRLSGSARGGVRGRAPPLPA